MIGLYLLLTFMSQFVVGDIVNTLNDTSSSQTQVVINFKELNGLRVGAPVTMKGEMVGTVLSIKGKQLAAAKDKKPTNKYLKASSHEITVSIKGNNSMLKEGLVALIASPLAIQETKAPSVVELLPPQEKTAKPLVSGKLNGFSSYKEFWMGGSKS